MQVQWDRYPEMLTAEEARILLRMSRNRIYTAIREGAVPGIKIGKKILIPKKGIEDMIDAAARNGEPKG